MWLKTKVAGFTLLECLLALLILSGSMLVIEGLTKLLAQEVQLQSNSLEQDWLLFSNQLRKEWEATTLVKVENNRIYIDKLGQKLAFGKSRLDDFRKTNDKGQGYQPMLYKVSSTTVSQVGETVELAFIFENGEERTFVYTFEKAG